VNGLVVKGRKNDSNGPKQEKKEEEKRKKKGDAGDNLPIKQIADVKHEKKERESKKERRKRGDGEVNQTYTTNIQKDSPKKDPKHIPMSRGRGDRKTPSITPPIHSFS
jgi:hypothetical protein